MLGVIINTIAVIIGSSAGLLFRRAIPKKYKDALMIAIGICTIFIGIQGSLKSENVLTAIIAMVLGVAFGTLIDIDGKLNCLGSYTENKIKIKFKRNQSSGNISQGMTAAFLLWCVGALTIVGSLQAGLSADYRLLYTKSILDFISSMLLASSLGLGVLLASVLLFTAEASLVFLSGLLAPILSEVTVNEITCVGSLIILALGFNLTGLSKFKTANFLPAVLFAPIVSLLISKLPV